MKKMKKIVALLLAAVMVMAMNVTVFAANADISGHTFTAYQIFTATSIDNDGNLGNLNWGTGISEEGQNAILNAYNVTTVNDLAKKLGVMQNNSDDAKAFAQLVYKYTTGSGTAVTSGTTTLPLGYYLVEDTTASTTEKPVDVYNLSVLRVSNAETAVSIESKVEAPKVEKKIVEGENLVDENEASIGDTVNYQITGTLPSNIADYEEYYVKFNDTLSKGLTYTAGSVKVTIDGVDVTNFFSVIAGTYSATNGTTLTIAYNDVKNLNGYTDGTKTVAIGADEVITVTYAATLNENAVVASTGNPNTVDLDYYNNPDNSGTGTTRPTTPPETPPTEEVKPTHPTGETPKDTVKTYTTEITITKVDESGNILTGAEFEITGDGVNKMVIKTNATYVEDENGEYYLLKDGKSYTKTPPTITGGDDDNSEDYDATALTAGTKYKLTYTTTVAGQGQATTNVKAFVGTDGKVTFTGLGAGTYHINETTTPTGYNTIKQVDFTVSFAAADATKDTDATFTVSNVTSGYTISDDNNVLSTTIENKKGTVLPSTGGIGTTIFYVLGTVLVLGAGVVLVAKRRVAR